MSNWPRIMIDVDDDRPATEDEIEYCDHCEQPVMEGELQRHLGERRCEDCRPLCPVCEDAEVWSEGEFCESCAWAAMGVEV